MPVRIIGCAAAFGVTALRARAVHVHQLRAHRRLHVTERAPECNIHCPIAAAVRCRVRCVCPIRRVIGLSAFVRDCGDVEHCIDSCRLCGVRRTRIVHDALQFFGIGQAPIIMPQIIFRVFGLYPCERRLPIHARAAVGLCPHQRGRIVCDGPIAVVDKLIDAVIAAAAHIAHKFCHGAAIQTRTARISFDAPIGKVDAELRCRAAHRRADVRCARPVLRVNQAFARARVAVLKFKIVGVNKRHRAAACGTVHARTDIGAAEQNQRIQFLNGRHAPIAVSADATCACARDRLRISHFAARCFHPHQARVQIGDGAVAIVAVRRRAALHLRVLSVKRLPRRRTADFG